MLSKENDYEAAVASFRWDIPHQYNIGVDVCDKWAASRPGDTALIHEHRDGRVERMSFGELQSQSNRAAHCFRAHGIVKGSRVAILIAQSPQTAIAHIAAFKLGAISVPLFALFGEEALEFRLRDSGASVLVTDAAGARKIAGIRDRLPALRTVFVTGDQPDGSGAVENFDTALAAQDDTLEPVATTADDPAVIIYTSGTTGKPKGALHAQRVLLGHLPGVEMSHGGTISRDDIFWTPADWAWIGGLLDVLLPALHHGATVVSHRFDKFNARAAFDLMSRHGVTHVFLPPTALKMLRSEKAPREQWNLRLRSVASGGESLGTELLTWGKEALGITINEFYGQTECNMVVSSCGNWFPARPGAIGRAAPGHDVRVVNDHGIVQAVDDIGNIAIKAPDPVMFLGYWNNPSATAEKFAGDYLLTGDLGRMDSDGFIHYVGRNDDVITSAGYRIGPGPIEDCLLGHPAVRLVAVVGVPDAERTEIVKACVVLADGYSPGEALTRELQDHVRTRLAAHEYPRVIEYRESLPMTSTGKLIRRELRTR
ncbi:acyl-CoA synthetase [Caballeronia sp. LZ062]|uniref:acyl-CoA synthetase n=1 Tax=unclassified Caballeronia TaxID=2646786 RepID=UPI0028570B7D|nr:MULTISPECIES: acyl-CoA synthetase [unclassified Caballeronia]MDR5857654.1 acyl-CoA synthetase [Caballeronia sp. LZ050]MDR5869204.1 acyl-CoA synthetase [Caballeronia sp. LZ062]